MSTVRTSLRCACGHHGILWKRIVQGVEAIELQYFYGGGEHLDDVKQMKCPACGKVGLVSAGDR